VEQSPHIWQTWVDTLNRWGLKNIAATFLDVLGPLTLLGAQVVYVGQPFLNSFLPEDHLEALADLLENPRETQAFISALRGFDDCSGV